MWVTEPMPEPPSLVGLVSNIPQMVKLAQYLNGCEWQMVSDWPYHTTGVQPNEKLWLHSTLRQHVSALGYSQQLPINRLKI